MRAGRALPMLTAALLGLLLAGCGGGGVPQYADGVYGHARPAFHPDGERILFAAVRRHRSGLYTCRPDGSEVRRLPLPRGKHLISPTPDPTGARVAFLLQRTADGRGHLAVANLDGSGYRELTHDPAVYDRAPAFSPDGRTLVFQRSGEHAFMQQFWTAPAAGGEPRRVGDVLAWSPTPHQFVPGAAGRVVFAQKVRIGEGEKTLFPYRRYHLHLGTGTLLSRDFALRLADLEGRASLLTAPDGETVVCVTPDRQALTAAAADGTAPRPVTRRLLIPTAFHPDGTRLLALEPVAGLPDPNRPHRLVLVRLEPEIEIRAIRPAWPER